ncbi:Geraniol dehydrogenase [bioreactor metagenome]|uniref:Geraniol dehydrogenase n=1 Tax=bioreactor metagenome TaxID=1076179 RepID=A0A645IZ68_9ZZZZ
MGKSWDGGIVEGSCIPQTFIPYILDLYRKGVFPIDAIVTRFGFEDINGAFKAGRTGKAIKPVVVF